MIFVELINEPPVWRSSGTTSPDELDGLCGKEAVSGDEITAYNSN